MMNRNRAFFLVTSSLAAVACVATPSTSPETTGSTQGALLGDAAVIDTVNTWSFGVCQGPLNTDAAAGPIGACLTAGTRCTGTLVAPNLVLTAQHCVAAVNYGPKFCDGSFEAPSETINVTPSDSLTAASPVWFKAKKVHLPPAPTDSSDVVCLNDVALIELETNVPAATAKPIAVDVDTDLRVKAPTSVTVVGRGNIKEVLDLETFEMTQDFGEHRRRVLESIPFHCAPTAATPCAITDYTSPPTNEFPLPNSVFAIGFGPAGGDSGSGIIDQASFTAKSPKVIGVISAGTFDADGIPVFTFGPRVEQHKAFLVAGATEAAASGQYPLPVWAGGTEPEEDAGVEDDAGVDAGEEPGIDAGTTRPDAGTTPDDGDDSSCSASAGTKRGGTAGFLASLGLLGLIAGRRRKSKTAA